MLYLKNAIKFLYKTPFQTFIIFLVIIVSVSVEFFILSLGSVMDTMILEQTTNYQDHIVINYFLNENRYHNELNYDLLKDIKENDSNIKYAHYFQKIDGDITKINNNSITPTIMLRFHAYDNFENNDDYLNYTGLNIESHLTSNSNIMDTNENEVMLDINFAKDNKINIGDLITYQDRTYNTIYEFSVVGTYDLGIFRPVNNYTFISLDKFTDLYNNDYSINIQLHKTSKTSDSLKKINKIFNGKNISITSWEDVIPEISMLNIAQKVVVLTIEVFISVAFFVVIVSILNYSNQKRYNQFGILKALGQTNGQINLTLIYQTSITSMFGLIFGLIIGTIGINTYSNLMTYPDGTKRFTVNLNFFNYFIPIMLTLLTSVLASVIAFRKIRKLTITELIKE